MAKKKNKDPEKRAALQAKKEAKADKAARKRLNKEKQQHGDSAEVEEDNFDALLEVYRRKDKDVSTTVLETLEGFPPPRANATLTLADDKNGQIYLFGGEYFDGVENIVLDDLFRWDPTKNEWRQLITPSPRPGPRCAHSCVYFRNALYVLAGELATADQYHHYRDIWRFDLSTLKWEEIQPRATGTAPTARSGHAAFVWKHYMIIFGGFYEALKDTRWYNDVCVMDLQSLTWMDIPHSKLASRPEPRSACNVGLKGDVAVIHGGYSKLKNPTTKAESKVHTDAWLLHLKPILQGKPPTWERLSNRQKGSSSNPSNRSGTASVTYKDRMLLFGGVIDKEELHHRVDSVFYNELYAFDMERRTWFPVRVKTTSRKKGKSRRRKKQDDEEEDDNGVVEEIEENEVQSEEESSDLEDDVEDDENPATSSGWDLDMLRSNMFAFIDGDGNIVYEKIDEGKDENGNDVDMGGIDKAKKAKTVVTDEETKDDDTDDDEEEAKGDDTDEDEEAVAQDETLATVTVEGMKKKLGNGSTQLSQGHIVSSSSVMRVNKESGAPEAVARTEPLPRFNAMVVVRNNVLFVYGGLLEVGDREITLDDCWSFDLRKRDKWECIFEGTMHKQVWRGAVFDDDDSYISTDVGADEDDASDIEDISDECEAKNAAIAAKTSRKAAKNEQEKSKRAGLRQEIADLKGKLDLDDVNRTPQIGEALSDFYSRTSKYWNDEAAAHIARENASFSETEKLPSKELKREGFKLASERYDELKPVLERLDELELQQREAEDDRKQRKDKRDSKGKKSRCRES